MPIAMVRALTRVYFPFEESQRQIIRKMRSIGIDLGRWVERGRLRFHPSRPQLQGLESHLSRSAISIRLLWWSTR